MINWQVPAILLLLLGGVGYLYTNEIRTSSKLESANKQLEDRAAYTKEISKLNQNYVDLQRASNDTISLLESNQDLERSNWRRELEKSYEVKPFETANDVERRIAYAFCLYESGNDPNLRSSCDDRARLPYSPKIAHTVAVTPSTAEDWRILCEETGRGDFCNYGLTAWTTEGIDALLETIQAMDRDQLALRNQLDAERKFREETKKKAEEFNKKD